MGEEYQFSWLPDFAYLGQDNETVEQKLAKSNGDFISYFRGDGTEKSESDEDKKKRAFSTLELLKLSDEFKSYSSIKQKLVIDRITEEINKGVYYSIDGMKEFAKSYNPAVQTTLNLGDKAYSTALTTADKVISPVLEGVGTVMAAPVTITGRVLNALHEAKEGYRTGQMKGALNGAKQGWLSGDDIAMQYAAPVFRTLDPTLWAGWAFSRGDANLPWEGDGNLGVGEIDPEYAREHPEILHASTNLGYAFGLGKGMNDQVVRPYLDYKEANPHVNGYYSYLYETSPTLRANNLAGKAYTARQKATIGSARNYLKAKNEAIDLAHLLITEGYQDLIENGVAHKSKPTSIEYKKALESYVEKYKLLEEKYGYDYSNLDFIEELNQLAESDLGNYVLNSDGAHIAKSLTSNAHPLMLSESIQSGEAVGLASISGDGSSVVTKYNINPKTGTRILFTPNYIGKVAAHEMRHVIQPKFVEPLSVYDPAVGYYVPSKRNRHYKDMEFLKTNKRKWNFSPDEIDSEVLFLNQATGNKTKYKDMSPEKQRVVIDYMVNRGFGDFEKISNLLNELSLEGYFKNGGVLRYYRKK